MPNREAVRGRLGEATLPKADLRPRTAESCATRARLRRETILPIKSIPVLVRLGTSQSASAKLVKGSKGIKGVKP